MLYPRVMINRYYLPHQKKSLESSKERLNLLVLRFQKLEIFLRVLKNHKLLMKKGIKLPLKIKVIFTIFKSYLLPFIAFFVLSDF